MVSVSWVVVNFLAPDIRKYSVTIARVHGDQSPHFGKRRCNFLRIVIPECKAHTEQYIALKTLAFICNKSLRIFVPTVMEQKGGDRFDLATVQQFRFLR